MRPNSKAASALALILAGLLARTTFAHPVCSSDVSCPPSLEERQVGDVEQWHGDLVARAGSPRLGSKRPPSEEDLNAPAKRPDTDDPNFDPEGEQSGAVSGPAWGQSSNPPSRAPDESTGPVPAGRPTGGDTGVGNLSPIPPPISPKSRHNNYRVKTNKADPWIHTSLDNSGRRRQRRFKR